VRHLLEALAGRDDVEVVPYLSSFRAATAPGERRLPLPAAITSRAWARASWPRADRWLADVDVVHGTNYVAPPTRRPTVISVYDCWFLHHERLATPVVRRAGHVLRRAVARGAWIHASSDATAAAARSLLATDRVVAVPLGPPDPPSDVVAVRPAGRAVDRPFVLALGTVERRKNLPVLVQAFGVASRLDPSLDLVVAGAPGDDQAALEAAISALPGSARDRVTVLGLVDDAVKRWLLEHATVLAYPSLDEGFGFPILEAQAAAVPVVGTRAGSIPEVAGDAARLVDATDVDGLATALVDVAGDAEVRAALVEAGHRNLDRFDWQRTAEGIMAVYDRAIEEAVT
jgi:glycosyltransferase involved in cell wall biosynthesis